MKRVTESECEEILHRIIGLDLRAIASTSDKDYKDMGMPFVVEEIKLDIDYDGIILDYEDLKATLFDREYIIYVHLDCMSISSALLQMKQLMTHLKDKNLALNTSDGILLHFTHNSNMSFWNLSNIMDILHDAVETKDPLNDINVLWGTRVKHEFADEHIQINLFVSYKDHRIIPINNIDYKSND